MRRVLPPELTFSELSRLLAAQGWSRVASPGQRPPLRPGEPEQARFTRGDARLIYSFNPVIDLRVLDGPADAAPESIGAATVTDWLDSHDPRVLARGCLAAAELALTELRDRVAATARRLPEALQPMGQAALRRLDPLPGNRPAGIFDALPVPLRLQMLRHMLAADPAGAAAVIPGCWSSGPELAATAMIAAARLGLSDQYLAVKRADLAPLARDRTDREVFTALKKACLATLEGQRPTPEKNAKNRFWRMVLEPTGPHDDTGLILHALTVPLPDAPQTDPPPDGFACVAQVPHWLGHARGDGLPNPLRHWTPEAPLRMQIEASQPVSLGAIHAELTGASHVTGQPLRLPRIEEWEAALRGPDGRRFPWGMAPQPAGLAVSPWGALWSGHAEWALQGAVPVLCGTDRTGRVSCIAAARHGAQAGVRGLIMAETP